MGATFKKYDDYRNWVECWPDGVFLFLKKANERRRIGEIDEDGNYIKGLKKPLDEISHKYRRVNGWGVNWCVVQCMKPGTKIIIYVKMEKEHRIIQIDRDFVIENPDWIGTYAEQGFETQYFIPEINFDVVSNVE